VHLASTGAVVERDRIPTRAEVLFEARSGEERAARPCGGHAIVEPEDEVLVDEPALDGARAQQEQILLAV
jgi:hypothetical protein